MVVVCLRNSQAWWVSYAYALDSSLWPPDQTTIPARPQALINRPTASRNRTRPGR